MKEQRMEVRGLAHIPLPDLLFCGHCLNERESSTQPQTQRDPARRPRSKRSERRSQKRAPNPLQKSPIKSVSDRKEMSGKQRTLLVPCGLGPSICAEVEEEIKIRSYKDKHEHCPYPLVQTVYGVIAFPGRLKDIRERGCNDLWESPTAGSRNTLMTSAIPKMNAEGSADGSYDPAGSLSRKQIRRG
ncbi:hypothetical protein SKAU_G00004200 [Synaphobranchus kaupii]|uniref:Uncharacterized protein n=1 Tax=Synaphobranchus kaupii TaxID=118154 RepID=A0A9Q1G8X6_SYNKA|nr:hypothetical protein SKAU_G00004200 [Synaphobranchus kaupii]